MLYASSKFSLEVKHLSSVKKCIVEKYWKVKRFNDTTIVVSATVFVKDVIMCAVFAKVRENNGVGKPTKWVNS